MAMAGKFRCRLITSDSQSYSRPAVCLAPQYRRLHGSRVRRARGRHDGLRAMQSVSDGITLAWQAVSKRTGAMQTHRRLAAMILSAVLMVGPTVLIVSPVLFAAEPAAVCKFLAESEVSSIAGETMHAISQETLRADPHRPTCKFLGQRTTVWLSLVRSETQSAASREFTHEVLSAPGEAQSDEPLRGVGVDARYRAASKAKEGTIIARFGTTVVVLRGNLDRAALVQLARAAAAHLSPADQRTCTVADCAPPVYSRNDIEH